jgi:hypothetical protein
LSSSGDWNFFFLFCLGFEDGGGDLGPSVTTAESESSSPAFLFLLLPTCGAACPVFFLVPATKRLYLTGRWGGVCKPAAVESCTGDTSSGLAAGAVTGLSRGWPTGRVDGANGGTTGSVADGTPVADADVAPWGSKSAGMSAGAGVGVGGR